MKSCMIFVLGAILLSGCAVRHIREYEPKHRQRRPVAMELVRRQPPAPGSLWSPRGSGATLFTDVRAFEVNDIVTIHIKEVASAKRGAQTSLDRKANMDLSADILGLLNTSQGTDKVVTGDSDSDFSSKGETARSDDVRFTVAGTISQVLNNGNLYIEGHRVVLVNDEEHHFYISGVARPEDIERDNSIVSYKLAEAHVEFTGRGIVSESQNPGWFSRVMNYVWPF
jgi:flagellar L-ring protein precursor FlgH